MSVETCAGAATVEGCLIACARLVDVADQFSRRGGDYSAIGPHLRHCVDHFACFFRGIESGTVEYDLRDRDAAVETDIERLRATVRDVMLRLAGMTSETIARSITVRQIPAPDQEPVAAASTVERELMFLSGHTIHHCAIVDEIAKSRGITLSPAFSVAFSTAAYRESQGETGR